MKQNSYFFSALLLTAIFLVTQSNIIRAQLNSAGTYVWNATDAPKVFNNKLQLSFVSNAQGFQSYGTILAGGGYSTTQDGAAFQIYFPYSPTYGGIAPQIRFGRYDNQGWSTWNTFFTSANANLPTADWVTKNLTAYGTAYFNDKLGIGTAVPASLFDVFGNTAGGSVDIYFRNQPGVNTSGTRTNMNFPVFNGAPGLQISEMTAATGGFNVGNYDALISTGQGSSYLHLAAGGARTPAMTLKLPVM